MSPEISYVIPFRDWGLERLKLASRTAHSSFGALTGEVLVSDFGSNLPSDQRVLYERELASVGARYVYTPTTGPWSITRATNAGVAASEGRIIIKSDADMLVQPGALEEAAQIVLDDPTIAVFFTCRDLPRHWDDAAILKHGIDWRRLVRESRLRPRWGMGLSAASRSAYLELRGWDERMLIYGGDDNDFSKRLRSLGVRIHWPTEQRMSMLHMWHPSTSQRHQAAPQEAAQILANKEIVAKDETWIRNRTQWRFAMPDAPPLVSVVIATYNRRAMLMEAIASVLAQTLQDFEIIVVDDGSTDGTEHAVAGITDSRVRYLRLKNGGVAAARNAGSDAARAAYIAVLDDDDIAPPWRLEAHFDALTAGVHATFGSFVNFDDSTGEMSLVSGREMTEESVSISGGAPGHSTWMVKRSLMQRLRYDEGLTSGVDNDLALRIVRSGAIWQHTGRIMALRRMHSSMITTNDSERQAAAASSAFDRFLFVARTQEVKSVRQDAKTHPFPKVEGSRTFAADLLPFLPDHLVSRTLRRWLPVGEPTGRPLAVGAGGQMEEFIALSDATWADIARIGPGAFSAMECVPRDPASTAMQDAERDLRQASTLNYEALFEFLRSRRSSLPAASELLVAAIPGFDHPDGERLILDDVEQWTVVAADPKRSDTWTPGACLLITSDAVASTLARWAGSLVSGPEN